MADVSVSLETLLRNVRFAFRQLRRSPGFAITATLALALGIGPNVAIFSIIWATFLTPPPYPNANQLVVVWRHYKGDRIPTGGDEYAALAAENRSFQSLSFQSWISIHLTNQDHTPDQQSGLAVSPGLQTRTVREPLLMGRDFLPGEGSPGRNHVVMLTNWLWQHRYNSDPHILGKSILIEDAPYTVIGVMRAGPHEKGGGVEFNVPLALQPGVQNGQFGIMIGRLKPGVSLAAAQAELSAIDKRYAAQHFGAMPSYPFSLTVEHFRNDWLDPKTARNLWLMLDAVGLVLLIACVNIANLLLARGASRRQELAVRSALGASRGQIFIQLLTESLTLALVGGAVGIALGWAIMKLSVALLPNLALEAGDALVAINLPVLGFAVAVAILAGVIAGCAPSFRSARINQSEALKQGARSIGGRARSPLQSALVSIETALALILLAGAGLALHSFWNLTRIDVGFRADHIMTAEMQRPRNGAGPSIPSPEQLVAQQRALLDRVRQIPGVVQVALASSLPMHGFSTFPFTVAGQSTDRAHLPTADFEWVTPSYFQTFGVRLIRGRFLNDGDTAQSARVIMVNETFVHRYLANQDPLSQRLQIRLPVLVRDNSKPPQMPPPVDYQIVGVFHDVLDNEHLTGDVQPEMYVSTWQSPWPFGAIVVRTVTDDPLSMSNSLQHAVSAAQPGTAIDHVEDMEDVVNREESAGRFEMVLFEGFAMVALLLACIGIYGVMSFAVSQRTHEIGVRMALGAGRSHVIRLILGSGMRMVVVGLVLGLAGALGLGKLMQSTLYGVKSFDALSLIAVAILLFGVGLLACFIPARRASAVNPMRALRDE